MSEIIKFDREGQSTSFEFADGNKVVNATPMAKPFKGKLVADFLRLKNTKDYILLLEARYSDVRERDVLHLCKAPELQGAWMPAC